MAILCYVCSSVTAHALKSQLDLLNQNTEKKCGLVYYKKRQTIESQVLIGTPLELSNLVLEDKFPFGGIRYVFFDDSDVTMNFNMVNIVVRKLTQARFIGFTSSVVHGIKSKLPDVDVKTSCGKDDILIGKISHFVTETNSIDEKMRAIAELIRNTEESVIIFGSVRKLHFVKSKFEFILRIFFVFIKI